MKLFSFVFLFLALPAWAQNVTLPNKPDSVRFAVIGDSGTGNKEQHEIARLLHGVRERFPYEFVLMLGDNLYGRERPGDFEEKFEVPYKPILKAGVKFYATLGNHDDAAVQRRYKLFNMGGERYYSFKPKNGVRFFALDSNYMDKPQLEWLQKELANSGSDWKIAFFHHPLYSSGKHGSADSLRAILEPLFVANDVSVVFAGHEHFYERIKPQRGINYFVSGGAGKLRKGDIDRRTGLTEKGFDSDYHFMLAEISGDQMHFQTISRSGQTIDSGVINRVRKSNPNTSSKASGR